MHVGINILYLLPGAVGGTETYAESLVRELGSVDPVNRYTIFANEESQGLEWQTPPNFSTVVCPIRAESRPRRYTYEQLKLPVLARRLGVDVLHSLGYVAPIRPGCPNVVSIHDLNYEAIPQSFTRVRRQTLRLLVPLAARRADAILTLSEFSRSQITSRLHVPSSKVFVIHAAAGTFPGDLGQASRPERPFGIERPFLFALSSRSPHKNLAGLLRAFALLDPIGRPHLVLAGHEPTTGESLQALVRALGLDGTVHFTGYLEPQDLGNVLRSALAFVFPSLYEGFGIPVLDAMAAGVPVVASNAASLPEIAGDAALLVDPTSVDSIADGLRQVISDPGLRDRMIQRGHTRAKAFSWKESARQTLAVYEAVHAANRKSRSH